MAGLLVAFDDGHRQPGQHRDGLAQQRRLARAGAGDQVQRKDAVPGQMLAVLMRIGVVPGQDVLLDLHPARGAEARGV
jgi:hypothetical protein